MDVHSDKGRKILELTGKALDAFLSRRPDLILLTISTSYPATVDYMIARNGILEAIVEFKVRQTGITIKGLKHGNAMYLSVEKFNKGVQLADHLGVPFYFWVYLPSDKVVLSWEVYNPKTGRFADFEHVNRQTQISINDKRKRFKPCIGLIFGETNPTVTTIEIPS